MNNESLNTARGRMKAAARNLVASFACNGLEGSSNMVYSLDAALVYCYVVAETQRTGRKYENAAYKLRKLYEEAQKEPGEFLPLLAFVSDLARR